MQDSSIGTPSRTLRYSGSERPACRMNHTGVCGTGSPRAARSRAESWSPGWATEAGGAASEVDTAPSSQVSGCSSRLAPAPPSTGRAAACRATHIAIPAYCDLMATRQEPRVDASALPEEFRVAVAQLRAARLRPEVFCEEMPAPQRIAPFASALSADVTVDGEEVGTGRIVLLHDPAGNDAWDGTFRCVAYARAEIDPEMANDPLLAEVGWSWLSEALSAHGASYLAPSGTVTKVSSESFGGMADEDASAQLEIRASWTPVAEDEGDLDLGPHVEAWGELLCTASGLPPVPEGVAPLAGRRGQRGRG